MGQRSVPVGLERMHSLVALNESLVKYKSSCPAVFDQARSRLEDWKSVEEKCQGGVASIQRASYIRPMGSLLYIGGDGKTH